MSIFRKVRNITNIDRSTLGVVLIYGASVSLLSLVIPIAVQGLVNAVTFTTLLQPVIVLTIVVFVILFAVASMRISQAVVVESIQQRMFAEIGTNLAQTLPRVDMQNFEEYRVSELVNRFFEVKTIQKSAAILLITGVELILLSSFSMVLVAFYHPYLLIFDIIVTIFFTLVIMLPWRNALRYAIDECEAKHVFAAWLEEIIHNILLFKLQNHRKHALSKADDKVVKYIRARQFHFRYILRHLFGINILYVFANASALGIGGYLVIKQQLSLGQLVAAELIISAMLYSFVRIGFYLQDFYDLLSSCVKLDNLIQIKCEQEHILPKKHLDEIAAKLDQPPSIQFNKVSYSTEQAKVLTDVNLDIQSSQHIAIIGNKGSGKSLLVDLLLGLREAQQGLIRINDIPLQDYDMPTLRKYISLVRKVELFSGSLYENLVLHRDDIAIESIHKLLNQVNLTNLVEKLPEGLDTYISGSQMTMSTTELMKLMFVRALLTKPSLLIIDGTLDAMLDEDLTALKQVLCDYPATVLIMTRRQDIASSFERYYQI